MIPIADSLFAAPEAAPSLLGAALRMGAALALLIAGASAWLYWHRRVKGPTRHLEILDRAMLARGASVALLRVGEKQLLIGVSGEGVRPILDLSSGQTPAVPDFDEILDETSRSSEVKR